MSEHIDITKRFFTAFSSGDRGYIEKHITGDFTFSSPPDPHLDKGAYFNRCWPFSGQNWNYNFVRILENNDTIVVTYTLERPEGTGQNTEVFTFEGDKIRRIEVYFGWQI